VNPEAIIIHPIGNKEISNKASKKISTSGFHAK